MCQFCSGETSDERFFLDYNSNEIVFIDNDFNLCIIDGEYYVTIAYCPICGRKLFEASHRVPPEKCLVGRLTSTLY